MRSPYSKKSGVIMQPDNLREPEISPNARAVLEKRYLRKNENGEIVETPGQMFWRVASVLAGEEAKYGVRNPETTAKEFYDLMADGKFLPNSPTLMNAGTPLGQLCACFVLPVGDSIEEIFDSIKHAAQIHKSGGGTGFSFSRLRPRDSKVGISGGIASGPVSFMRIFNTATEQIKQGGARRGANMGILNIDHPDIEEFLRAKEVDGEFNNFNLSVGITEDFMKAVENSENIALKSPFDNSTAREVPATQLFDLLVEKAWQSGDPGIIFLDRINRDNPTPADGIIEATNPCGEQPLLPYEACNLGSINLAKFFRPEGHAPADMVDWEELGRVVDLAVRFLDNVIDASAYPLPQIAEMARKNRKIGLGIMGFADLLFKMDLPYDSEEALAVAEKLMNFINQRARLASQALASERGPFPGWKNSALDKDGQKPSRNATVTTIAPTGTLSIIAGCASGIEPAYGLFFTRTIMDNDTFQEWNPVFKAALARLGDEGKILAQLAGSTGRIRDIEDFPENMRRTFVTAMEIAPEWHLRMQAAFQAHTDNAVSKTVNLPASATREDVARIFLQAWKTGCKGITVYRDGSKRSQVLDAGKKETRSLVKKRPDSISGFTRKVRTGLGTLYLTVNELNGRPFEVFATIGKSGRSITAKAEAIGRLVSLALRSGVEVADIVAQIKGIGGEHPVFRDKGLLLSIPDAIAWVLENKYMDGKKGGTDAFGLQPGTCPECGASLIFQEGCMLCQTCGYSRCG